MLRISNNNKTDTLSAANTPAAVCSSGDTVVFQTQDCFDGAITRAGEHLSGKFMANPATGPLYVNDSAPGDTLKIEVISVTTRGWGAMGTHFGSGAFSDIQRENTLHAFDFDMTRIHVAGLSFTLDPMIGVIGVAPAGEGASTILPGTHGGNMDCSRIRLGSKVYLPIACKGALLSIGDLHALMGDGEVFGYGLETSGDVTTRITVIKDYAVPLPIVVDDGDVMAVASAPTLEEASKLAMRTMYNLLLKNGLDETEAGLILSLKCCIKVCQLVNPLVTVRAELPRKLIRLP